MKVCWILLSAALYLAACKSEADTERIPEVRTPGGNADLIRNPETADAIKDTVNVARISLDHLDFAFDTIKEGQKIKHVFPFVNTGKVPLIITDVQSSCGCTAPDWPKHAIAPGDSSSILVEFNSASKYGQQDKTVTIISNAYPAAPQLRVIGYVLGKKPAN